MVAAVDRFSEVWSAPFPAEQARIVKLLVERVTVTADGLAPAAIDQGDVALAQRGPQQMVGDPAQTRDGAGLGLGPSHPAAFEHRTGRESLDLDRTGGVGQTRAHSPQPLQAAGSIRTRRSAIRMAASGQASAQARHGTPGRRTLQQASAASRAGPPCGARSPGTVASLTAVPRSGRFAGLVSNFLNSMLFEF